MGEEKKIAEEQVKELLKVRRYHRKNILEINGKLLAISKKHDLVISLE